jgi:hypothetical protein
MTEEEISAVITELCQRELKSLRSDLGGLPHWPFWTAWRWEILDEAEEEASRTSKKKSRGKE